MGICSAFNRSRGPSRVSSTVAISGLLRSYHRPAFTSISVTLVYCSGPCDGVTHPVSAPVLSTGDSPPVFDSANVIFRWDLVVR